MGTLKTNISKFQFDSGMHGHFWTSSCELLSAPWVNKLHLHFLKIFLHRCSRCELCHYSLDSSRPSFFRRKVQEFGVPSLFSTPELRFRGRDMSAKKFRPTALFLGGPRLPPGVVSARLNFLAPKNLLLDGKKSSVLCPILLARVPKFRIYTSQLISLTLRSSLRKN